jgi:hypothetical protein
MFPDQPRGPIFLKIKPCWWNPLVGPNCLYSQVVRLTLDLAWSSKKIRYFLLVAYQHGSSSAISNP